MKIVTDTHKHTRVPWKFKNKNKKLVRSNVTWHVDMFVKDQFIDAYSIHVVVTRPISNVQLSSGDILPFEEGWAAAPPPLSVALQAWFELIPFSSK